LSFFFCHVNTKNLSLNQAHEYDENHPENAPPPSNYSGTAEQWRERERERKHHHLEGIPPMYFTGSVNEWRELSLEDAEKIRNEIDEIGIKVCCEKLIFKNNINITISNRISVRKKRKKR